MAATDSLLTTKLYLPPRRSRLVPRPRLLALLSEGLTRPLTLISAPAGFGKTTLLSEWRDSPAGQGYPLAWVSLDLDDNDPSRFLLYLLAALGTLNQGIGESALAALQSQQPPVIPAILTSLVNDLNTLTDPFALVLDDYHLITSRAVHDALRFLLEAMPSQMHMVLLTRADPPLPLARLRARDQLTEIRLPGLRFQAEEATHFLNEVMELGLSAADIAALESRTEGWIAGLQLAAVSLQQQADKHAFVAAFAGDDRYVMDYLLEEVLQRQSQEVQSFLLKTSILERLNGPLCQAVSGQPRAQVILADLEQANLFVTALDNKRYWYRYHPLFADLLRHRLRQSFTPAEWMESYERACEWYESQGLIVEAVSQAMAAPDHNLAADLMERHALTVFYRGETMLVHHWLKALPEAVLRRRALLCALYANTIGHAGSFQPQALTQSENWLQAAEQALEAVGREKGKSSPLGHSSENLTRSFLDLSRAYVAYWKGEPPQAVIDLAQKGLAGLPPEAEENRDPNFQRFRSGLINNLGLSYLALGDEDAAIRAYKEAQRIGEACGDLLNMYSAIANQSLILRRHGRLHDAANLCRKAIGGTEESPCRLERSIPYLGVVYASLGRILLEWNDLDAAERVLSRSLELSRLMAAAEGRIESSLGLAWLKLARRDFTGASDLLDQLQDLDSPKARALIVAMRVRLYLAQSSEQPDLLRKAMRWAEGKTFTPTGLFWQMPELLALARVRIAERSSAAQSGDIPLPELGLLMRFLEDQLKKAGNQDLVERMVELHILRALAWQAQNEVSQALDSLQRALSLAEPAGYIRLFVDEGVPMRRLLTKLKTHNSRINDYIIKLLSVAGWGGTILSPGISQSSMVELLSQRELEVLQLLAEGASNADIARKLFITLNTTKKHVTHIFEKLAVTDRAGATRRAREIGLLASRN